MSVTISFRADHHDGEVRWVVRACVRAACLLAVVLFADPLSHSRLTPPLRRLIVCNTDYSSTERRMTTTPQANNSNKSRARRASLGAGPSSSTTAAHFLKGVAVAALPNVLDLPDPPTPLTQQQQQQQQQQPSSSSSALQPQQWKKRRRRHSVAAVPKTITTTTTATAVQAKATNNAYKKPAHKKSKQHSASSSSSSFEADESASATLLRNNNFDSNNTPDSATTDAASVDYYQLPDPLHPLQAPPPEHMRGVLDELRCLVHAYTNAQQQSSQDDAADSNTIVARLQQQIRDRTSNHYVLTPPLTHQQVFLQSNTTNQQQQQLRQQQQQPPPQLRSEYDRRVTLWVQLGPAMQQLDQHKQATAVAVAQAVGLQVEKAPGSHYSYYYNYCSTAPEGRRRRVAPEIYEQRYHDMLQQQTHRPDWGAYFDQLQRLDAAARTTTDAIHTVNDSPQTSRAPSSTASSTAKSAQSQTSSNSNSSSNMIVEKLPHSDELDDGDLTVNLKSCVAFPNTLRSNTTLTMAFTVDKENASTSLLASSSSSSASNIVHRSDASSSSNNCKLIMDKQQSQSQSLLLPPRPLARAVPSCSRSLQDLTTTSAKSLRVEPSASLVNPNSSSNETDAVTTVLRSPLKDPADARDSDAERSPPSMSPEARPFGNIQTSRTISNIDGDTVDNHAELDTDDGDTTEAVAFDLLPIPDRDAPSLHPEIAAAEERLFQALDVALDTYSREVTEIRQREVATQQGGDGGDAAAATALSDE